MSEETKTIVEIGQLTEYWPVHIRSYTDTFCYVYPVLYKQETEWNGNEWYDEYTRDYRIYVNAHVIGQKKNILKHPHRLHIFHPKRNIWTHLWKGV